MNVLTVSLLSLFAITPVVAHGGNCSNGGIVEGPGQMCVAPAPGHYQVNPAVQGVMVYAQPPGDNPPDCNATPSACLGYVVPSGEIIDCNEQSVMCTGTTSNLPKRDPVARVHFSYWDSAAECATSGGPEKWCDRNNHLFQFGDQAKVNSGEGYIQRKNVEPLPYRDGKTNKLVNWGQYDGSHFDEQGRVARARADEAIIAADDKNRDPKNEVVVLLPGNKPAEPGDANAAGCGQCGNETKETEARLLKEAREAEAKAYSGDGCVSYPFTLGCNAQSSGNGFGFLAHASGNQCAICFTQQVTKGDFCGDPQTMPVYKLESMSAMLVKKSANLCKAAADQFSKMCGPWKTTGSPELRKEAVHRTEGQLLKAFMPDTDKIIKSDKRTGDVHLKKSAYLSQNLMECLLDREDVVADPAIPNFTLCNDTEYKRALEGARAEVKALKKPHKGQTIDYDKIRKADAELHTFENKNDSGPHDRPFVLESLKRYHEKYLSSATGLDMITRSTVHRFSDNARIYDGQCTEFSGYWENVEHFTSDPMVSPFFSNHQCKEADPTPGPNGEELFAERLFGLKSKDPTVQLEVRLQTYNYLLNFAEAEMPGSNAESIIRRSLKEWFGGNAPMCSVNEVYACKTCMDHKGTGDKSCLELTHPSANACQSVKAIVNNQLKKIKAQQAKTKPKRRRVA